MKKRGLPIIRVIFLRNSTNNEAGFTLIELIVAMLILSTLSLVLGNLFVASYHAVTRIEDNVKSHNQILLLTRLLRMEVNNIQIPFWLATVDLLPDGQAEDSWEWKVKEETDAGGEEEVVKLGLYIEDEGLRVKTKQGDLIFPAIRSFSIQYLEQDDRQVGLRIRLLTRNAEELFINARFGGFPIPMG